MKNIKAVIFDLNGVFITSPKLSSRFCQDFGIDETVFLEALKDVMAQVRKPDADGAYTYWQPYFQIWNVQLNETQFLEYWFSAEKENPEMISIAKKLKEENISLFILSNNLKERSQYYKKYFSFLGTIFKKTYYSWQTGFIKPDRRSYGLVLQENGLQPDECVYFDDSQTNVDVAREIGINAFLFKGSDDVKEKLSKILISKYWPV